MDAPLEWIKTLAALAGALAWPAVVVVAIRLFRDRLARLIDRIEGVKSPLIDLQARPSAADHTTAIAPRRDLLLLRSLPPDGARIPRRELEQYDRLHRAGLVLVVGSLVAGDDAVLVVRTMKGDGRR